MKIFQFITKIKHKEKGFTLLELLVVIAILGILAAGLLAAIDPLEQINKGRDTSRKQIAVELVQALQRYYGTYSSFPWGTGALVPSNLTAARGTSIIASLVSVGELKSSFLQGVPAGVIFKVIAQPVVSGGDVYVCIDPISKSVNNDPATIYTSTANPPATGATCPNATGTCFFCAR